MFVCMWGVWGGVCVCVYVCVYMYIYVYVRVGVKYSTCIWYLYLSTYLSVLDVLEYLVYGNVKVLVLVLDQKYLVLGMYFQVLFIKNSTIIVQCHQF